MDGGRERQADSRAALVVRHDRGAGAARPFSPRHCYGLLDPLRALRQPRRPKRSGAQSGQGKSVPGVQFLDATRSWWLVATPGE